MELSTVDTGRMRVKPNECDYGIPRTNKQTKSYSPHLVLNLPHFKFTLSLGSRKCLAGI